MKIAVAGNIRSGKDTLSDYFIEMNNLHQLAFAEGIADVIDRYFPDARKNGKPRKHYQVIGQAFRELNPDIWVEWLDAELKKYPDIPNIIVTDLRQPNEYDYLAKNGFTIVKVEADFEIRKERALKAGDNFNIEAFNHETEMHIAAMPCDYLVSNNDTLEGLYMQADFILKELKGENEYGTIK